MNCFLCGIKIKNSVYLKCETVKGDTKYLCCNCDRLTDGLQERKLKPKENDNANQN